jgi:hypothetical protein
LAPGTPVKFLRADHWAATDKVNGVHVSLPPCPKGRVIPANWTHPKDSGAPEPLYRSVERSIFL